MEVREQCDVFERMRSFLLGADERFEERLMTDEEFFREQVEVREAVLDELVDDYFSDALTGDDKIAFEERLLPSPEVQSRLTLGHALAGLRDRPLPKPAWQERFRLWVQPVLQPVPALAACLFLVVLGGGIRSQTRVATLESRLGDAEASEASLRGELDDVHEVVSRQVRQVEAAAARLIDLEASIKNFQGTGVLGIASSILGPGIQRSNGNITVVSLVPGQRLVELKLDLGTDEYGTYRAILYDSAGNEVLAQYGLPAIPERETVYVILPIPAQVLGGDTYRVTLSGLNTNQEPTRIDDYSFIVAPQ